MNIRQQLYKSCLGYYVDETKAIKCREIYYDAAGRECKREVIKKVQVTRYIQPDTMAIALWLTVRQPDRWKIDIDMLKQNDI